LSPFDSNTNNNKSYILTDIGISWKSDMKKYANSGYTDITKIRPPPNWRNYRAGYSATNPPSDLSKDEHFQVWMRTAGLPNFRKLYAKNEQDDLMNGTYTIDIDMSKLPSTATISNQSSDYRRTSCLEGFWLS
jgi:hypothetical protein